jgi:hypothetical protein
VLLERDSAGGRMVAVLYRRLRAPVERLLADPQRELERDVWRLGMLRPDGGGQTVDYTAISQSWLRELVKGWNRQRLVSHSIGLCDSTRRWGSSSRTCFGCGRTTVMILPLWGARTPSIS